MKKRTKKLHCHFCNISFPQDKGMSAVIQKGDDSVGQVLETRIFFLCANCAETIGTMRFMSLMLVNWERGLKLEPKADSSQYPPI